MRHLIFITLLTLLVSFSAKAQYWILQEEMALSYGYGEAPNGANLYEQKEAYEKSIQVLELKIEKEIEAFENFIDSEVFAEIEPSLAPLAGLAAIAKKEIEGLIYDDSVEALKKRFLRKELLQIASQVGYKLKSGNKTKLADWIVRQIRFRDE